MSDREELLSLIGNARFSRISFCVFVDSTLELSALTNLFSRIDRLSVPTYEILVAGTVPEGTSEVIDARPATKLVEIPVSDQKRATGSLLQALAQEAAHPLLCYLNGTTLPAEDFYAALAGHYTNSTVVLVRVCNEDGSRYWDWASRGGPEGDRLLPYNTPDPHLAICPALFMINRAWVLQHPFPDDPSAEWSWEVEYSNSIRDQGGSFSICTSTCATFGGGSHTQTEDFTREVYTPTKLRRLVSGIELRGSYEPLPDGWYPIGQRAEVILSRQSCESYAAVSLAVSALPPESYDQWPCAVAVYHEGQLLASRELSDDSPTSAITCPIDWESCGDFFTVTVITSARGAPSLFGDHRFRATPSLLLAEPYCHAPNPSPEPQPQIEILTPELYRGALLFAPLFTLSAHSAWLRELVNGFGATHLPVWPDSEASDPRVFDTYLQVEANRAVWHERTTLMPCSGGIICAASFSELDEPTLFARRRANFAGWSPAVGFVVVDIDLPPPVKWRECLACLDEVWVISSSQAEAAVSFGAPTNRTHVVPLGIDVDKFQRPSGVTLELDDDGRFIFLADTDFTSISGWDVLLRAYLTSFTIDDPVLLILRSHTMPDEQHLVDRRLEAFAVSCGRPLNEGPPVITIDSSGNEDELIALYQGANAVVATPRTDRFPLSIMQATAAGKLIICPDTPTLRELCAPSCTHFVPNEDGVLEARDVGEVMRALAGSQSTGDDVSDSAKEFAKRKFSIQSTIDWIADRLSLSPVDPTTTTRYTANCTTTVERIEPKDEADSDTSNDLSLDTNRASFNEPLELDETSTTEADYSATLLAGLPALDTAESDSDSYTGEKGDTAGREDQAEGKLEEDSPRIVDGEAPQSIEPSAEVGPEPALNEDKHPQKGDDEREQDGGTIINGTIVTETTSVSSARPKIPELFPSIEPRTVGIDARLFAFPELRDRGIGSYTTAHLRAVATIKSEWRFILFTDPGKEGTVPESLLTLPTVEVVPYTTDRPHTVDIYHVPDQVSILPQYPCPLSQPIVASHTTAIFYDLLPLIFRDIYFSKWPPAAQAAYQERLEALFDSAAHILAISQATASDLLSLAPQLAGRITVIFGGAPPRGHTLTESDIAASLSQLGVEPPYFLVVGGLDPHKNFPLVLEALTLVQSHMGAGLVVAGSFNDPYKEAYKNLCAKNHLYGVHFTGFVPDHVLTALYAKAVALVFPSFAEGLGLPVLEAMAKGCPVIASTATALKEVTEDAAILVDPNDARALARAMVALLDGDGERMQLRERGFERARRLTWEKVAHRTISKWLDLLDGITTPVRSSQQAAVSPLPGAYPR